jgi:hypothetical protein
MCVWYDCSFIEGMNLCIGKVAAEARKVMALKYTHTHTLSLSLPLSLSLSLSFSIFLSLFIYLLDLFPHQAKKTHAPNKFFLNYKIIHRKTQLGLWLKIHRKNCILH